jgi:polyphosphate kinase 2
MTEKEYEQRKYLLQIELLKWQRYVRDTKSQHIIIFEGRDAAGKGGTIKRFMEHLNPRYARVVALDKPTEMEQREWYWQRYIRQFPQAGEITLWDRSWYNRAMVEPVMGFCTADQTKHFYKECTKLEQIFVDAGIQIVKFFLAVSQEEQTRRFNERMNHPLKVGKMSAVDLASQSKWDEYSAAIHEMINNTDRQHCPWTVINSDCKRTARIRTMQHVLKLNDYLGKDINNICPPSLEILSVEH